MSIQAGQVRRPLGERVGSIAAGAAIIAAFGLVAPATANAVPGVTLFVD
jgi:hypothetical protein